MSTTPAVPTQTFWQKLKALLPAIEMAGNIALLASPFAGFEPLVAGLETATQSLVQSIGQPASISDTLMTLYATILGVLVVLKAQPNLPADLLAKVEGYIVAVQNATAAYVQAESGFSALLYTPVTPIA